jgi:DNA-binding CsgD family transcriptional regulator
LKPAQIDALIAGYEAGKTMKDLAVEFGINRLTVSAHLRRAGVPLRRSGLDTEQTAEAARLYDAGWSSVKLAERFGVSADTVLIALRRAAVVIRPHRGGPPSPPAPR